MEARAGGCVKQCTGPGGQRYSPRHTRRTRTIFPYASDNHWGFFLTQVPKAELEGGVEVERLAMSRLGF